MSSTTSPPKQAVRRRASRAAGPTGDGTGKTTTVRIEKGADDKSPAPKVRKLGPPPRRAGNRRLVVVWALVFGVIACAVVAALVTMLLVQKSRTDAIQARDQRFVDTAKQTVENMLNWKQTNLDDRVNRFYAGTSGPLRDMLSQGNNVSSLKAMYHATGGSSEGVINGAALESYDSVSNNASVIVSTRVTIADQNGNNRPSTPYRWRIIVHEDDDGTMTAYDLKFPNGGT